MNFFQFKGYSMIMTFNKTILIQNPGDELDLKQTNKTET